MKTHQTRLEWIFTGLEGKLMGESKLFGSVFLIGISMLLSAQTLATVDPPCTSCWTNWPDCDEWCTDPTPYCISDECKECGSDSHCDGCAFCDLNNDCNSVVEVTIDTLDPNYFCVGSTVTFSATTNPSGLESEITWDIPGGDPNSGQGSSINVTFSDPNTYPITAGCGDGSDEIEIVVVEVASVTAEDITSTTDTPGVNETVYVPKGGPGETITITATPNPLGTWPNDKPTWTNATATATPGQATFPIDTASPTSAGTTVTATCGTSSKAIRIVVTGIVVLSADASTPSSTKINYRTDPIDGIVESVSFSAPGTTDSKSNVSGNFYFTYDQSDIGSYGTHTIRAEYGDFQSEDCTVTKTYKMPPDAMETLSAYFLVEGVGLRVYNHSARETYKSHTYSVSYSGKTINTIHSAALMFFGADYSSICSWTEQHKYSWSGGDTSWVNMTSMSGLYPPNTDGMECTTVTWLVPTSLEGIAKCTGLLYDYGGGSVPGAITNAEVDRSMPE